MFSNDDMPHACGIDKSGGAGNSPEALTASGISNVPTDNALRTASVLSSGSVTEGITPETLADATMAALDQSKGYESFSPDNAYKADGKPSVLEFKANGGSDPAVFDGGDTTTGFLGRNSALIER